MKLKISQFEIYKSSIRLKDPFITSLGALTAAENIIVVIRTNNGITGFGECSPFMTINGESADTCFIVGEYLAKVLLHCNPLEIAHCSAVMDACIYGNSSIKSAFDIALYDIASQNAGLPLYKFLNGNNKRKIITDYTVSIGEPDKMAADAAKILENGFQIIKVKLGGLPSDDVQRIKAIREVVGSDIPIRIDANQGWNTQSAISVLKELAAYNIQHCEEPIPRWNFMELALVRKQSPIKIMADESCCDHHDAERLIGLNACDAINIKLGKSSGIYKALQIIRAAEKVKLELQVGGFLESRLGFTAAAHLALTSDAILYFDFDTPLMFVEDYVSGGIIYHQGGVVEITEKPGLGATVDEQTLNKLEKIIIS